MRKLLYIEDNEDSLYMLQLRFDVLGGYRILSDQISATIECRASPGRP
jgi:hypothetical protein